MTTPRDDRVPMVRAYGRATRGMTVAIGMALPGVAGHFVDDRLGTKVLFTVIGSVVGLVLGIWQLMRMSRPGNETEAVRTRAKGQDHGGP